MRNLLLLGFRQLGVAIEELVLDENAEIAAACRSGWQYDQFDIGPIDSQGPTWSKEYLAFEAIGGDSLNVVAQAHTLVRNLFDIAKPRKTQRDMRVRRIDLCYRRGDPFYCGTTPVASHMRLSLVS